MKKETKEGWEKKFDDEFSNKNLRDDLSEQKVSNYIKEFIRSLINQTEQRVAIEKEELAEALLDMYGQYCGDGHCFMSAGEGASNVLERLGYAKFDGAGRIIEGKS